MTNADFMASGWYYAQQEPPPGHHVGPFTWEQLYLQARAGSFTPDDLVWHESLPDWVPAGQISGLFPAWTAPVPSQSRRHGWLLWAVPLCVLILVGVGLGVYFGFLRGDEDSASAVVNEGGTTTTGAMTATTRTTATMGTAAATATTETTTPPTTGTTLPVVSATESSIGVGDEFRFKVTRIDTDSTVSGMAPKSMSSLECILFVEMELTQGAAEAFASLEPELVLESGVRREPIVWIADGMMSLLADLTYQGGRSEFIPAEGSFTFVYVAPMNAHSVVLEFSDAVSVDLTPLMP